MKTGGKDVPERGQMANVNNTKVLRENRFAVLLKCGEHGVWYNMGLRKKAGLGIRTLWLE